MMSSRVFLALLGAALITSGQTTSSSGAISVTVLDQAGALVPNATLELKDLGTNDVRKAATQDSGAYTFPNLPFGTYSLTITVSGFQTAIYESVQVQTSRLTEVRATLQIGGTTQTVHVSDAVTPLVEVESSVLANTIDTKQVVNLPIVNRNVMGLAFLVPGWASVGPGGTGTSAGTGSIGTWNNMPGGAVVGADFDGTPGISNRFRSGGFQYGTTSVQPRIENVAEMTIQTGQLDLSGTGTSAMRISIVTRRGTNAFHGRLFEDFRNSVLQANTWINNARGLPRGQLNLNDFGGNVGGPILKNKLFFFFTYAQSIQPSTSAATTTVLSPGAMQGLFTYRDTSGNLRTVDVLQVAGNAGYRSTVLPTIADQLQTMRSSFANGTVTPTSDPNINNLNFQWGNKITNHYPAVRVDYNATDNVRLNVSYAQQKGDHFHRYNEQFPGVDPLNLTSSGDNNRIAGVGVDWVIRPTLINQFRAGYMYQYRVFSPENLGIDLPNIFEQTWGYGTSLYGTAYPRRPISSFYPLLSANDSLTWQKGAHSFVFGGSWYREQDHYWNGPGGEPNYNFNIATNSPQDPVIAVINAGLPGANANSQTQAQNLYAELTGRIAQVNVAVGRPLDPVTKQYKPFGAYNLNEINQAAGFFAQDRWRIRPNLTLNYGIRWDIVGDNYNKDGAYSSPPSIGDLWGPTPVGAIFAPGAAGGVTNPVFEARQHAYKTAWKNFSPAIAIAWSPQASGGWLEKLFGNGKTVIRTGYSLRHYTEGAQNFWAFASNSGAFFFQSANLQSVANGGPGTFQPGSLTFGDPLPAYATFPPTWASTLPATTQTFGTAQFWGMNPNIRQPYVEQWNFGIQRQLGSGSAIEVRYVGNLSLHQWLSYNINEINIFENGFLTEFQNAQNNLRINQANGRGNTFANNGLAGQASLPIFAAAFGSAANNYTNGAFIQNLQNGAAGALATVMARNQTFFCNMVGTANFSPCAARGINVPGAGYPINFWQVNPYATSRAVNYLDAAGMSNYHALQVDFRQRPTHGMQFNVNYTLGRSLGISAQNGIQGQGNNIYYTARNFRLNYAPSLFDIRHVFRVSGTYDLPFGKGRKFLSDNKALDYIVGGWTLGTITTIQSGTPAILGGGFGTVNTNQNGDNGDSGVVFNGATVADFQKTVGVHKSGNPWVTLFNPLFIGSNGAANPRFISPQNQPGVFGYRPIVYGPGWYNIDLSVNKAIPIRESIRFVLQAQFLNATNHPTFQFGTSTDANVTPANNNPLQVQGLNFGQTVRGPTGARVIEIRANIEF